MKLYENFDEAIYTDKVASCIDEFIEENTEGPEPEKEETIEIVQEQAAEEVRFVQNQISDSQFKIANVRTVRRFIFRPP